MNIHGFVDFSVKGGCCRMVLMGQIAVSLSPTSGFPGTTEANHTASGGALVVPTTAPRGDGGGEAFYLLLTCCYFNVC